ncbi:hypothetical protein E8L99_17625 [Phreatobacter aquaticus]|uniref:Uncharacterized protein n=1 Tax=Phreatobacter aquaticus TaxID=2570229 RepID=A0A4D7QRA2_9HYPH|nr:hypothetical protein [Phreatobacter aquaticus]QCK87447.1 hypothetical protein E8L99_17625 [Phreatobacter aquaticus]
MATLSTIISVSAQDQASGVLNTLASNIQRLAGQTASATASMARNVATVAAVQASQAAQAVAAPIQNAARSMLNGEVTWQRAANRYAMATENLREAEARSWGATDRQIEARREQMVGANMRRHREALALAHQVARESGISAGQVLNGMADLAFAGMRDHVVRALMPGIAKYALAGDTDLQTAATATRQSVMAIGGEDALNNAQRATEIARRANTQTAAAANATAAKVQDIEMAMRSGGNAYVANARRAAIADADQRGLSGAERQRIIDEAVFKARREAVADAGQLIDRGFEPGQAGRAVGAMTNRLSAMTPQGRRAALDAGVNPLDYMTLPPNVGQKIMESVVRSLPQLPEATRRAAEAVWNDTTKSVRQRYDEANAIIAQRGGAGGTAMTVRDSLKAQRLAQEAVENNAVSVDIRRMYNELKARGMNEATMRRVFGAHYSPEIAELDPARSAAIAKQIEGAENNPLYLESLSNIMKTGLPAAVHALSAVFDEFQKKLFETFGPEVIAGISKLREMLTSVTDAISAKDGNGDFISPGLREVVKWASLAAAGLAVVAPIIAGIALAALGLKVVWGGLMAIAAGALAVVKFGAAIVGALMSIPVAIGAVVAAAAGLAIFNDLGGSLAPFMAAIEAAKAAWASLVEAGKAALSGDWSKAGELAMSALRSIGSGLWSLGESLGRAALGAVQAAGPAISSWASEVWQSMKQLGKNMEADFDAAVMRFGESVRSGVGATVEWLTGAWDSAVASVSAKFTALGDAIKSAIQGALDTVTGTFDRFMARIDGWIASLRSRLPSFLGGTPAEPATPAVPSVPQLQGPAGADWTEPFKRMGGAASEAERQVTPVSTAIRDVGTNAGSAAGQLDAVRNALSAIARMPVPAMPSMPAAPSPAAPAVPAVQPVNAGQSASVQGFRSFQEAGVEPRAQRVEIGSGSIDVRVRAERGSEAFTSAQTSGRIAAKLDAGVNDSAWI